jgi:hypothetical protein
MIHPMSVFLSSESSHVDAVDYRFIGLVLLGSILCARSTYMGLFIGSRVVCTILVIEADCRFKELEAEE